MNAPSRVEKAKIEFYRTYTLAGLRSRTSPRRRRQLLYRHVIVIDGERYEFLASGSKRRVFGSDTVSFDWKWDATGRHRKVDPDSLRIWDRLGKEVRRGPRDLRPISLRAER